MTSVRVAALSELPESKPVGVEVDGEPVVLVRAGDEVHALADVCSHAEVALSEGEVTRDGLECWLHGSCFDLRTGRPGGPPANDPVDVYPVTVAGDDVLVDVTTTTN